MNIKESVNRIADLLGQALDELEDISINLMKQEPKTIESPVECTKVKQALREQLSDLVASHPVLSTLIKETGRSSREQATAPVLKTVEDKTLAGSTPAPSARSYILGKCVHCQKMYKVSPLAAELAVGPNRKIRLKCKNDGNELVILN